MKIGRLDTRTHVAIVAEIGNNHEGDLTRARRMIHAAAEAGVDAVKFQTIIPERLVCAEQQDRLAQLRRFQLSRQDHETLAAEAAKSGVVFLSTPFDIDAVDWLDALVPAYKVASGDNDFWPLLERLAKTGKPVIVSLGLGGAQQAPRIVEYFQNAWQQYGTEGTLALLHCVSAYPTPEASADLGTLYRLRELGVTVGYSDHTLGIKAAELAVAAGARIIEKHFTLDKAQPTFRDHQLSADPSEMRDLVAAVRRVEQIMGTARNGAPADEANKTAARRSIAAARDLPEGTVLKWEDLTWLRPGSGLRPGEEQRVLGRKTRERISAGHLILPDHLS